MRDFIEVLTILLKYMDEDVHAPFYCGHDELNIYGPDVDDVSAEDISRLDELGVFVSTEYGDKHFKSFRYGSC